MKDERERARGKVEFSAETRRRQISLAETAGGEEEFPSRLEAKSSGQRAGGTFSHRHFSRVHRCYNSAVVHRRSYVSLGEGELKLNWRELRQGTLCFGCFVAGLGRCASLCLSPIFSIDLSYLHVALRMYSLSKIITIGKFG